MLLCGLVAVLSASCSTTPTSPTSPSAASVVATVSQEPPPVPPRLGDLPPPRGIGLTRFVAFGDSITYGTLSGFDGRFLYDSPSQSYPVRLQLALRQTFPNQASLITVINAGKPGEQASQGRLRIQSVIETHNPQAVLVLEGVNDLTFGIPVKEAAASVRDIVDRARQFHLPVLVALMPQTYSSEYPDGTTRSQASELIVPFNAEVTHLVSGLPNVYVIDLYSRFGTNRSLMGNDGLHPTDAGYELMASTFAQAIELLFPVRGSVQ